MGSRTCHWLRVWTGFEVRGIKTLLFPIQSAKIEQSPDLALRIRNQAFIGLDMDRIRPPFGPNPHKPVVMALPVGD